MSDLLAFLAARLDEDENLNREMHEARVCSGCSDGWEAGFDPDRCDCDYPARVLRQVAAGRRILERYEQAISSRFPEAVIAILRDDVADLAAVYSDHPDYDEKWRP